MPMMFGMLDQPGDGLDRDLHLGDTRNVVEDDRHRTGFGDSLVVGDDALIVERVIEGRRHQRAFGAHAVDRLQIVDDVGGHRAGRAGKDRAAIAAELERQSQGLFALLAS